MSKKHFKNSILIVSFLLVNVFQCQYGAHAQTQMIKVMTPEEVSSWINTPSHKIKVINFWASWCGPCIREIGQFSKLSNQESGKVDVLLLSLDDPSIASTKLKALVKKRNITGNIGVLNTKDMNQFINQISQDWSGAIPATIFISQNKTLFLEKEFKDGELLTSYKKFTTNR